MRGFEVRAGIYAIFGPWGRGNALRGRLLPSGPHDSFFHVGNGLNWAKSMHKTTRVHKQLHRALDCRQVTRAFHSYRGRSGSSARFAGLWFRLCCQMSRFCAKMRGFCQRVGWFGASYLGGVLRCWRCFFTSA